MSGYKQMLRDRMPEMLNYALTYCKAKSRWIDYVYDNLIKKYSERDRSTAVKVVLGVKQMYKRKELYDKIRYNMFKPTKITKEEVDAVPKSELYMSFKRTIDFEKLEKEDPDMCQYWKDVASWVDWFSMSYVSVRDTYLHAKKWQMTNAEIRASLMAKYSIDGKLVDFLIKTF